MKMDTATSAVMARIGDCILQSLRKHVSRASAQGILRISAAT